MAGFEVLVAEALALFIYWTIYLVISSLTGIWLLNLHDLESCLGLLTVGAF